MSEAYVYDQPPPLIPSHFNSELFCSPEANYADPYDILVRYDPNMVTADSTRFFNNLSLAYEIEKAPETHSEQKLDGPGLDLRYASHIRGITGHTIIHAVCGEVEAGVSDTDCIPYWDRQAAIIGMEYVSPESAQTQIEIMDVLSINTLRAYCTFYGDTTREFDSDNIENRIKLIEQAMARGQRSKLSVRDKQEEALAQNKRRLEEPYPQTIANPKLYAAKLKHLAWLVDQQTDPRLREYLAPEVKRYVDHALTDPVLRLSEEDLAIDMGVDTGISTDSSRPPYEINVFVQLAHLHDPRAEKQLYSLPQEYCHRLQITEVLSSINRPGTDPPFYEQDGRYLLPWRFDQ